MGSRLAIGVLGGAGFIGRRLVPRLVAAGHAVRVGDTVPFDAVGAESMLCDVTDPRSVDRFVAGMDVVYNLAAEHRDDVRPLEKYREVNVGGAQVLCAASRRNGIQHIRFTSTVAVYGFSNRPAEEGAACCPSNEYGRTKWEAEQVYRAWADEDALRSLGIIRPSVVFGEGNRGNVYNLARHIAAGKFIMVGDGRNRKSLAYVDNVADFMVHILSLQPGSHVFNYADGPDLDMNQLVGFVQATVGMKTKLRLRLPYAVGMILGLACDAVARVTGRPFPVSAIRVRKFCSESRIVAARALGSGFKPAWTLEQALQQFLIEEFPGIVKLTGGAPGTQR